MSGTESGASGLDGVRSRLSTFIRVHARTAIVPSAIGGLVVALLAAWLTSPRFSVTAPSLIDDWAELRWSPLAFHQALHLGYDPATYDGGRYRPGFWAFWAQLQWHTLGAPHTMRGPNLWNVIRNGLFGLGLASVVVAAIRPAVRARLGTAWLAALAAVPGALVVSTPQLTHDFARLGPQEPLLVGGMALGLVLTLAALYRWVGGAAHGAATPSVRLLSASPDSCSGSWASTRRKRRSAPS